MTATTAGGLPYPEGTDRVMDGDDAIKALAQALDPVWTVLVLNAGWTARAGSLPPAYRVIAGVVWLRGQLQKATAIVQGESPFTFPAAARPSTNVGPAIAASRSSGAAAPAGRLDIPATGVALLYTDSGVGNWFGLDGVAFSK